MCELSGESCCCRSNKITKGFDMDYENIQMQGLILALDAIVFLEQCLIREKFIPQIQPEG
jgi:hypothetical protein